MEVIECTLCRVVKPATGQHFPLEGSRFRRQCYPCRAVQKREARQKNETPAARVARIAKNREYVARNREKLEAAKRVWLAANKQRLTEYFKAYYQKHKDRKKAQASSWSKIHREWKNDYNRRWAAENAEAALNHYRVSKRKRRQDPKLRLFDSISEQIRCSLRTAKNGRQWERLVGFTRSRLVDHLERQFCDGMSWENYGDWHIDHIIPASSFRYATPEEPAFQACWQLTNLRPMWAKQNISKGARRLHLL